MPTFVAGTPLLACDVSGSGPAAVFLHGIGGNRTNWQRQRAALDDSFTSIAWDARGYGDSTDVDGPRDFGDFGDDLVRLLDHFDIERAHLIGLSMGARILMEFAPRQLQRVATLTLCDCFPGFASSLSPAKQREYVELRERPLLEGKTFADLAPKLVGSLVSSDASDEVCDQLRISIEQLRPDSYLKTLRASVTFDQTDTLSELTVPTQLIFGSEDHLTPPAIGSEMIDLLPDARLAVIPGAGHLSNLEAPNEFNQILATFLREHRDRATYRGG